MYLISAYFDEKTSKRISKMIDQVAGRTENLFMAENHVPPHLTISSVEAESGDILLPCVERLSDVLSAGTITIVSVGVFFPYVIFLAPLLDGYLQDLSRIVYESVSKIEKANISRYYQPKQWFPHITIGKKLTTDQMRTAFEVMQKSFSVFRGEITSIGLAKTNPHEDMLRVECMR